MERVKGSLSWANTTTWVWAHSSSIGSNRHIDCLKKCQESEIWLSPIGQDAITAPKYWCRKSSINTYVLTPDGVRSQGWLVKIRVGLITTPVGQHRIISRARGCPSSVQRPASASHAAGSHVVSRDVSTSDQRDLCNMWLVKLLPVFSSLRPVSFWFGNVHETPPFVRNLRLPRHHPLA